MVSGTYLEIWYWKNDTEIMTLKKWQKEEGDHDMKRQYVKTVSEVLWPTLPDILLSTQ